MSLSIPEKNWFKAPAGAERMWIGLALIWCFIMSLMMPYWHFRGKQNSRGEAYSVTPEAFMERTMEFTADNKVGVAENMGLSTGFDIAEPPPGGDAYLLARMWNWYPILKLRKDETYRIHMSSMDLQHGFSLQPLNMNFQISPGYDHVLTITPTSTGEFTIVCNEFCGIGHDKMIGKILVE